MITRLATILLLGVATMGCDKVKSLASKATNSVKEKIESKGAAGSDAKSTKVDEALQKLVDQTAEGAVFRKDLPFPTKLDVRITNILDTNVRCFQESAIERGTVSTIRGTMTQVTKFERQGNRVCRTVERASMSRPAEADPKAPKDAKKKAGEVVETVAPSEPPITFVKEGKTWQAENRGEFRARMLSSQLSPVFDVLLESHALAPRPLWFSKHRMKVGDELEVAGKNLPMVVAGNTQGSLKLKLESFEAVEGHPCGVFSVTGNFQQKQLPDFNGGTSDEDVTIQTGKIWFSLLYPVILKQQLDTIVTMRSNQGGVVKRNQGSIKATETVAWKRLEP